MKIAETIMANELFTATLIAWYSLNKRDLPWRNTSDSYHIWLSEVILQQTRVNQGLPYYYKFVERFPTVEKLAQADEREVLRAWQGLGYYSRARNLHKCAKIVAEKYQGKFPKNYQELLKLPGIGRYTAAAIASIANREKVAVVDGNVYRVLSRVFGIYDDIGSNKGQKQFQKLADDIVPDNRPDIFNQAIMEFGALQCTPKSPDCDNCPLSIECHARIYQKQTELPVKVKRVKVRHRYFHYLCIRYNESLLMKERKAGDIWQGLFDFYLIERDELLDLEDLDDPLLKTLKVNTIEESTVYKHILTHQQIKAKFYTIELKQKPVEQEYEQYGLQFFSKSELLEIPKSVLISSYLKDCFF